MLFLISYDLNSPGQDYPELYAALNEYDNISPLRSVRVIKTNDSVEKIYAKLKQCMDENDHLLVMEIGQKVLYSLSKKDSLGFSIYHLEEKLEKLSNTLMK